MIFSRVECDCPITNEIGSRFRSVGDFYSVFFNAIGIKTTGDDVLAELLQSDELANAVPKLLPLNLSAGRDYAGAEPL